MKVLFATSECAPFIKTGGLGDVAQALPQALAKNKNVEVCVFMPYYRSIKNNPDVKVEFITNFEVTLGWRRVYCGVFKAVSRSKKLTHYFIDNEYYFDRETIYGHFDDGERFAFFSKAILESLQFLDIEPDVMHCNDWQSSLIPLLLKANYSHLDRYKNIKTILTIHNIEYQGIASNDFLNDILGISDEWRETATFLDCINFMKSAIILADKVTTVSKTYSYEIRHAYFAHHLENILQMNSDKIEGIINGIDTDLFNPQTDKAIKINFTVGELDKKAVNKAQLQKKFGLPINPDVPVIGLVSRLVAHKGVDLIEFVAKELMEQDLQIVILGTGDKAFEDLFYRLQYYYPEKIGVKIAFDSGLASIVYAGSDFLLMPSKSEPCGLSQLIAMRYGTIPIVRETGGLFDTVPTLDPETLEGRGFTFKLYNAHDMLGAIKRATDFYHDKPKYAKVVKNIMEYDCSWSEPVKEYIDLYNRVLK